MTERRPLVFGAILNGVGGAGGAEELWQHPEVPIDASSNYEWYISQAEELEAALFDFILITDGQHVHAKSPHHHLSRLEPITLLSAIAARTSRIGLVATVSTTYTTPWDIARRLASLDHISGGRAAWNIVTSYDPGTAKNFGRSEHSDYEDRYAKAHESVDVVRGLWDSYEDDAFASSKNADRFLNPSKLHALDHSGTYFDVAGPLNIARSPQGHPVLVQAGVSEPGRELNGRVADVAFSFATSVDWAVSFADDVRARAVSYGRDPEQIMFLPALGVVISDTNEEAEELHWQIIDRTPYERQFDRLQRQYPTIDLSGLDPEGRLPDFGISAVQASNDRLINHGRNERWTVRRIVRELQLNSARFWGSPTTVADQIQQWYEAGAADGFVLFVGDPEQFRRFAGEVVPELQRRGIYRAEYSGPTLRDQLGLPRPERLDRATPSQSKDFRQQIASLDT
ncbi:NtaA/DmoA family FMN-dependent monooxygenase [Rhodococcus sp. IEGM 1241]|uniref:NtaA/DmoA family FMN-dependent monooxygenase n=1 Tax=Rhodococcus sp. IEGM 1241 TaxID=3082228 RepID=UPI002952D962|nr:NtaA/DmoA family FMN-dependent monooxygenase [Rhodococcus sp. IEGM 1241]MDV8013878.1 NtaA/DmoA family FMN-dependent monooxygenase [Rhodococcus sp. IEGM 1241]